LSGGREEIRIQYEPDVELDEFESKLRNSQDRDMRAKMTSVGPHRDDFSFLVGDVDIRKFGSQGQQRTAALSLKLAEIDLVKQITKDTPVLLLDDVLSELDNNRQKELLELLAQAQEEVMNGNEVSTEFARVLFPPARKEYELTYYGKESEQAIISQTFAVPLQENRRFGEVSENDCLNQNYFCFLPAITSLKAFNLINPSASF
jgi:hypothetical protein